MPSRPTLTLSPRTVEAESELFAAMLLSRVGFHHLRELQAIYRMAGSARAVVAHAGDIRAIVSDASPRLVELLSALPSYRRRAEEEMEYVLANGIKALTPADDGYPQRLSHCVDAPLVLYQRGGANLNARRVVSVVGTRRCTRYGQDLIRMFVRRLSELCPGALVVSGLAYGVDVCAHRECLDSRLPTVGVLAHGLDDLYPRSHRVTADKMVAEGGGLLTEFMTHTVPDKVNFVRRNRIVAGVADAVVLVESAAKGGGLITCGIARDYGRDVFAFPGSVGAAYSEGCNRLVRDNGAGLITSADDLVEAMGWQADAELAQAQRKGVERDLFPTLSDDEQRVVDVLARQNDLQINELSVRSGMAVGTLSAILFSLEMKGLVRAYAGGSYHLLAG